MVLHKPENVVPDELADVAAQQSGQVRVQEHNPAGAVEDGQARRRVPLSGEAGERAAILATGIVATGIVAAGIVAAFLA